MCSSDLLLEIGGELETPLFVDSGWVIAAKHLNSRCSICLGHVIFPQCAADEVFKVYIGHF